MSIDDVIRLVNAHSAQAAQETDVIYEYLDVSEAEWDAAKNLKSDRRFWLSYGIAIGVVLATLLWCVIYMRCMR